MIVIALLSAATLTAGASAATPARMRAEVGRSPDALVSAYVSRLAEASGAQAVAPSAGIPGLTAPSSGHGSSFDAKAAFNSTCAMCHGQDGSGNGPAAAAMSPKPANFTDPAFWKANKDAVLLKAIKDGAAAVGKSPLMPAWGATYNDADIHALLDYIQTSFRPKAAGAN